MSQRTKLNLWQKIKQLLTASTVQSAIDEIKTPEDTPAAKVDNESNTSQAENYSLKAHNADISNSNSKSDSNSISSVATDIDADTDIDIDIKSTSEPHSNDGISIVDYLKQYFNGKDWHYTHYQPATNDSQQSHHLFLRMRNKQLDCGYLFRVQETNNLLAVYGVLPFLIPESHQSAAMLLITQINYDMLIGNLEMDINDGEIRYKNAIDIEAVGIDDDIIEHLLQSVVAMTTVTYEIFSDLISNQDPAKELQTLLTQLRQQADSRTFFLPTQFVQ
ncbi:YbjN domain-containing protein [Psychrobacter sp. DAB_AL43B]|uniref:YbjN domain-containing protein n=1 Tax=Psychrobacter sp. DAB_AL43B TaxID=1028416 RepID=UPI0009A84995|nr:YbjN domain-containing protein [Psychrobacter sp. DAB_AL43B]SLJ85599.1 hypothetical protein DABAL43B_2415 [Psychrobacter sp. DAB_AL43B]